MRSAAVAQPPILQSGVITMTQKSRAVGATFRIHHKAIQARESLSTADVFGLIRLIGPRWSAASLLVTCYLGSQFFDLVLKHKLLALERCNVQVVHCR